ncbi:alpha/beta fold hydrolase [Dactylosporangium sp. NPDC005572]|uniref:alpha/beta hydrolase n=1 Tax=Dactylosporangium sp. NPDC005572 TaxID=3156889 RepID=UPI0033B979FF
MTVEGIPFSALVREVTAPRAVVVALHGGGSDVGYFDAQLDRRLSLFDVAAALGFTVVALNRPGYGSSHGHAAELGDPERRTSLAWSAVDALLAGLPRGAGSFLMAHSMGCTLGVRMAATASGAGLLGLELSGIGLRQDPRSLRVLARLDPSAPRRGSVPAGLRDVIWGPEHLYPEGTFADGVPPSAPVPWFEGDDATRWPAQFPALAARVTVPVRYSLGDHECWWRPGPQGLAEVATLFTAAPRVVTDEQAFGGHNLSLGLTATAYHLKVLAFAEECIVAQQLGSPVRQE